MFGSCTIYEMLGIMIENQSRSGRAVVVIHETLIAHVFRHTTGSKRPADLRWDHDEGTLWLPISDRHLGSGTCARLDEPSGPTVQ